MRTSASNVARYRRFLAALAAAASLGTSSLAAEMYFTERVISTTANWPVSVFAADVDGDGDTDVLSAGSDTIAWYESDGGTPPAFTARVISTTAIDARSVFAADVDGDGDTDVLSASLIDDKIAWYDNDGGTPPVFSERVISTAADGAWSVFAADVDGDGDTDVLSASREDNKIAWYESDGGSPPVFTERVISTAALDAICVFAADVDGDGDTDVLSASRLDHKIAWYESDGGSPPAFTERAISTTATWATTVFAADMDGDGNTDVLSASSGVNNIAWYDSDGGTPPAFTERAIPAGNAWSIFAADVDGDGDTDVLNASGTSGWIAWYESDGGTPPAFTERMIDTDVNGAASVFAADVDGDGDTDVLSASILDHKIAWYENGEENFVSNLMTGQLYPSIAGAIDAAVDGDVLLAPAERFWLEPLLDFDGKAISLRSRGEIVQPAEGLYTLAPDAALESEIGSDMTIGGELLAPVGADVDLLTEGLAVTLGGRLRAEAAVRIFVTTGVGAAVEGSVSLDVDATASFSGDLVLRASSPDFAMERVIFTAADDAFCVFAADVDGDGDTDVLSASQADNKIAWYESDGGSPPAFTERVISTAANGARSVFAADVDGDGDIDVLSASRLDDTIAWYESDGGMPPAFAERVISTAANDAQSVFAADVDGDGDTDVLSASRVDNKIAWYESDGGSPPAFTERVISTAANGARSVFAADVDGDGDTDVLSASRFDDKIAWYDNDGGTPPVFSERVISTAADQALSVFAADVDGDGDTDVLSASLTDDKIAWYESDGGMPPAFTERVISTAANGAITVFAADVDGDGDTDVLSASAFDDKIAWYENDGGTPPAFAERVISTAADFARCVFAADLDGDGDTDVLSASGNDDKIAWYENRTTATVGLSPGSAFSVAGQMDNQSFVRVVGGTLSASDLLNSGNITMHAGSLVIAAPLVNAGMLEAAGLVDTDVTNDGQVVVTADLLVAGDYDNAGNTFIRNGTLTIMGSLTNDGRMIGEAGGGVFVEGNFIAGTDATVSAAAVLQMGGTWDMAIDDSTRFALDEAELRMAGLSGQTLEVMSRDVGTDPAGFDPDLPGSYPIGTVRIGPTPTAVQLVDVHDNDGLGQDQPEAVYTRNLVVHAGATLITDGHRVYYRSLALGGTVDDPANLVRVACAGDTNLDGVVNVSDLVNVIVDWGCSDPPGPCLGDVNGDGTVDVSDLVDVIVAWGPCP